MIMRVDGEIFGSVWVILFLRLEDGI